MTRMTIASGILLFIVSFAFAGGSPARSSSAETEIGNMLTTYARAYERKDLDTIMSLVAENPVPIFVDARTDGRNVGLEEIRAGYAADFARFQSAKVDFTWLAVESKGPVAWFASEWVADVDTGNGRVTVPARWTAVLRKKGGKWLFVQSHFSYTRSGSSTEGRAGES